jgi:hypothetical protein
MKQNHLPYLEAEREVPKPAVAPAASMYLSPCPSHRPGTGKGCVVEILPLPGNHILAECEAGMGKSDKPRITRLLTICS